MSPRTPARGTVPRALIADTIDLIAITRRTRRFALALRRMDHMRASQSRAAPQLAAEFSALCSAL